MRPSISTAHSPAAGPQPPHAISAFQRRKPSLCGVSFRRFCFISFPCKKNFFQTGSQGITARVGTQSGGQRRKYH